MIKSAKLEDAVTGQQELPGDCNLPPAVREGFEVIGTAEHVRTRPDIVGLEFRPEWYSQAFKVGCGTNNGRLGRILDGDDLDGKIADGKCTHIHQPTFAGGEFRLMVKGYESPQAASPARGSRPVPQRDEVGARLFTPA